MTEPGGYDVVLLQPGLWAIDDDKGDPMYLIEGAERALLVDTGMSPEPILPVLRTLTDKPIALALTHAHVDHMFHADAFDTVYLHEADIAAWRWPIGLSMWLGAKMSQVKRKKYSVGRYIPITEQSVIDLGGVQISVIHAKGHTPGSVLFVDKTHRALFMGDAVGSGAGAWMWLPGSSTVREYRDSLTNVINKLAPYRDYAFLGGHRRQGVPSHNRPNAHLFTITTIEDMRTLCEKMLTGQAQPGKKQKMGPFTLYRYDYGTAGMLERKRKIK